MDDLRGSMTDLRSDMQNDIRDLRGDVRVINARLDAMQTKFGWYMAMFGVVITVAVAAVQTLLRQRLRSPSWRRHRNAAERL